jgi:hypothetical protein
VLLHHALEGIILRPVASPIIIPASPLSLQDLERFHGNPFDEMIKYVVDVERDQILQDDLIGLFREGKEELPIVND